MASLPATTPRHGYHRPNELSAQIAATSNKGLLTTFAALTHQMTGSDSADLRTQRDAVEAELLRRMTAADVAYTAGVDAGAAQAGRVAAAAMCGTSA